MAYRLTKIITYRRLVSTVPVPLPPFLSLSLHIRTSSPAISLGITPTTSDLSRGFGITHNTYPIGTLSLPLYTLHFTVARNETKFIGVRTWRRSPLLPPGNSLFAPIDPRGLEPM